MWRPVPPSAQFVALGMVATLTDEPPSIDALACVPRKWAAAHGGAKRLWVESSAADAAATVATGLPARLSHCVDFHI